MTTTGAPHLLAYLHMRPGTPDATPALLHDYIAAFARREGYHLTDVLVGVEGRGETSTVTALLDRVRLADARTVLTLDDVSPAGHRHPEEARP
jgi:hypothetical protein